jgi:hypothetical protein
MAVQAAKRGDRIKPSILVKTDASESLDAAVKDLIDNLIVPRLVEEFISHYGPASAVKQERFSQINPDSRLDSELDLTP